MATATRPQQRAQTSRPLSGPPILSFFTGAGFLDLGFMRAGFHVVWRNEFSKRFIEGFEYAMANMGYHEKINNSRSIVETGPNEVAREAFEKMPRPEIFGIIGGPPCPDFSVGGKNRGHQGDNGRLSKVYVSRIMELRPAFFLFENVPGLIRTAKHRAFLQTLLDQLSSTYALDINIVNALEYGVPQDRERVLVVGVQKKLLKNSIYEKLAKPLILGSQDRKLEQVSHWFPWEVGRKYAGAKAAYKWPETDPFGSTVRCPQDIPRDLMVGPVICDPKLAKLPNGSEHFMPYSRRIWQVAEGDVSRKSFKRLHRWRFSPAAAYGNNEVHLHPTEPRRLTVREAMRIQTVPDAYALPASMPLSHKFKTIGNGVPVKLAEAIATGFKTVLGEIA